MTTELEQVFYKTFEIEPIPIKSYGYWLIKGSIAENDKGEKVVYPEITDKLILEMIIMYLQINNLYKYYPTIEDLKNDILKEFITRGKDKIIKHQIQQLFKGEEC